MLLCLDWQWQRAEDEAVSVHIGVVLFTFFALYLGYWLLSVDSQGALYGIKMFR